VGGDSTGRRLPSRRGNANGLDREVNLVVADRSSREPQRGPDLEGDLLVRCRRDPSAFADFYDRTHTTVLRFFLVRTACAATSADLCSETFAGALAGFHRFDPAKGTGRGWLAGIARHVFQQYLRDEAIADRARNRMGITWTADDFVEDLDRINQLVDFRPMVMRVTAALQSLSEPIREAVLLRIVDQLPYDEIANKLGCTVGTARVRVCRGLDQLEWYLEAE